MWMKKSEKDLYAKLFQCEQKFRETDIRYFGVLKKVFQELSLKQIRRRRILIFF
jgi:hypothetical protein